jgi:hypothetical protein
MQNRGFLWSAVRDLHIFNRIYIMLISIYFSIKFGWILYIHPKYLLLLCGDKLLIYFCYLCESLFLFFVGHGAGNVYKEMLQLSIVI